MKKVWLVLFALSLSVILINSCGSDRTDMGTNSTSMQPSASTTAPTSGDITPSSADALVAKFKVDSTTGSLATEFTFDSSPSTGNIAGRIWDFADGTTIHSGKIVTHKFENIGTYNVKLRVKGSGGAVDYASRKITVLLNSPPIAKFTVDPPSGDIRTRFHFDASASSDAEGRIASYRWDFGDGSPGGRGQQVDHAYQKEGNYSVTLTVKDIKGQPDTATVPVKVETGGGGACRGALMPASPDSLSCGGFVGQLVCVASISGNVMTTSPAVVRCPGKCGEFRRDHEGGLMQFAGSIARLDGTRVTLNYGRLPSSSHPRAGETLRAIWIGHCH